VAAYPPGSLDLARLAVTGLGLKKSQN
jgi:hypothetical protein